MKGTGLTDKYASSRTRGGLHGPAPPRARVHRRWTPARTSRPTSASSTRLRAPGATGRSGAPTSSDSRTGRGSTRRRTGSGGSKPRRRRRRARSRPPLRSRSTRRPRFDAATRCSAPASTPAWRRCRSRMRSGQMPGRKRPVPGQRQGSARGRRRRVGPRFHRRQERRCRRASRSTDSPTFAVLNAGGTTDQERLGPAEPRVHGEPGLRSQRSTGAVRPVDELRRDLQRGDQRTRHAGERDGPRPPGELLRRRRRLHRRRTNGANFLINGAQVAGLGGGLEQRRRLPGTAASSTG